MTTVRNDVASGTTADQAKSEHGVFVVAGINSRIAEVIGESAFVGSLT
jgi:hypothetical protein